MPSSRVIHAFCRSDKWWNLLRLSFASRFISASSAFMIFSEFRWPYATRYKKDGSTLSFPADEGACYRTGRCPAESSLNGWRLAQGRDCTKVECTLPDKLSRFVRLGSREYDFPPEVLYAPPKAYPRRNSDRAHLPGRNWTQNAAKHQAYPATQASVQTHIPLGCTLVT